MKKIRIQLIIIIIFILSLLGLTYSIINIIKYKQEESKINDQLNIINDNITVSEENYNAQIIEQNDIDKSNPYWKYIKTNLLNVNFNKLKKINKDTKGWIKVNGTNINYPFVQTKNNKYYLTHSFDKTYNTAGWVFLDYRNDLSNLNDKNTILYAHGRIDKTMFGSLKNILTSGWLKNNENYIVRISTEYENTLWQVFSIYHIPTTSDYIQTKFNSDEEFKIFADTIKNRSAYYFNTSVSPTDRILTLSTCYNNNEKLVLHAKLIKRTVK